MKARIIICAILLFLSWTACDFFIHGHLLGRSYLQTRGLWRNLHDMKLALNALGGMSAALGFSAIYAYFVNPKSLSRGVGYGALFGFSFGAWKSLSAYAFMPLPLFMTEVWFLAALAEGLIGGLVVGALMKPR